MLGWHISVFRLKNDGSNLPETKLRPAEQLAVWQCGVRGLDWLDPLILQGHARVMIGTGYPNRYTALAEAVLPIIRSGPPGAREVWIAATDDVIDFSGWTGKTLMDQKAMAKCEPDEWLLVEAWDES